MIPGFYLFSKIKMFVEDIIFFLWNKLIFKEKMN